MSEKMTKIRNIRFDEDMWNALGRMSERFLGVRRPAIMLRVLVLVYIRNGPFDYNPVDWQTMRHYNRLLKGAEGHAVQKDT